MKKETRQWKMAPEEEGVGKALLLTVECVGLGEFG